MPFVACPVGIADGTARCRKEAGKCDNHTNPKVWPKAPRPIVILVKVNVNDYWRREFEQFGIQTVERDFERAEQLEQKRVLEAKALGRNAYAVRQIAGRDKDRTPEVADSGCPVFGPDGLADLRVSIKGLGGELHSAGFILTNFSLLDRPHKSPVRLVLEYTERERARTEKRTEKRMGQGSWDVFNNLISTVFDQVDVWANPLKDSGAMIVHTVNCGKRNDAAAAQPSCRLHYAGGDWAAEEIPTAAVATK